MKKIVITVMAVCLSLGASVAYASQTDDIKALQSYMKKKFPTSVVN